MNLELSHRGAIVSVDATRIDLLPPVQLSTAISGASMHVYLSIDEAIRLRDALDETVHHQLVQVAA